MPAALGARGAVPGARERRWGRGLAGGGAAGAGQVAGGDSRPRGRRGARGGGGGGGREASGSVERGKTRRAVESSHSGNLKGLLFFAFPAERWFGSVCVAHAGRPARAVGSPPASLTRAAACSCLGRSVRAGGSDPGQPLPPAAFCKAESRPATPAVSDARG